MRKSVGQAPTEEQANKRKKKSVGQSPTVERANKRKKKKCRTSPDIGAEWENHDVGQGLT